MNKRNSSVILALSAVFLLASCGGGETSSQASQSAASTATSEASSVKAGYTITFETNGGSAIEAVTVDVGGKLSKPADPTKEGYLFSAWYEDSYLTMEYDFSLEVKCSFTLYAGYTADPAYSSAESEEPVGSTLYFQDAHWWNENLGSTSVSFTEIDPTKATEFTPMANYPYDETTMTNVWYIDLPVGATGVMFIRTYTDSTSGELKYGGTHTAFLPLPTDGNDMYILEGSAWTTSPEGHWGKYGGGESSSEASVSSQESGEYTYAVTDIPSWITDDDCIIFAWAWASGASGQWYACNYTSIDEQGHATGLTFDTATEMAGMLLVRCIKDTETPNWDEKGNNPGRIYNKTKDFTLTSGVYEYSAPNDMWVSYN